MSTEAGSASELQNERQFVSRLYELLDELRERAETALQGSYAQVGKGLQARVERDVLVAERSGLLDVLNSVESGLCFGRIDFADGTRYHIGRIGIRENNEERTPLVIDWRARVARPFYLATGHSPMGLRRRRHLTTHDRTVTALHDEILDLTDAERTGYEGTDADAVLLAALDSARTGRMHDIVQTIQAEQDEIIRAPYHGVLVVEGGPGTGKTAVALHRAAYLLYAYREQLARRAVLIVGPNPAFLGYIGEVLPSLGETGVLLATPGELFPGVTVSGMDSAEAASVKGRPEMADALADFVRDLQRTPEPGAALVIAHDDGDLLLDWTIADAARSAARATGLPHNLARPHFAFRIIDDLTAQLADRLGADPYGGPNFLGPDDLAQLGKAIAASAQVHAAIEELWPQLNPQQLVAGYLADPVHLPEADAEVIRREAGGWTIADVPLLDEAAELLGDDDAAARAAAEAARQEQVAFAQGVLDLSLGSESYEFEDEESEVLAAHDIIDAERMAERHEETDGRSAAERAAADRTWAFGHIIVDEAQELSAMQWRLLMRRSPTRSTTLVGDPAQTAEPGGCGSWEAILAPYVEDRYEHVRLGINYRTPQEIMDRATAFQQAEDPSFEAPRSIRSTGVQPWARRTEDLPRAIAQAVSETRAPGRLAVIAPQELHTALLARLPAAAHGSAPDLTTPVVLITPRQAKGLEFDTVIVAEPQLIVAGSARGSNDLYVALTRATQRLGMVYTGELPEGLAP